MKKALSLFLAGVMATGLVACSAPSTSTSTSTSTPDSQSDSQPVAPVEQVLKVAALESAYGVEMWEQVCKAFEEYKPGVTVELTINNKIEELIGPGMKAGEFPDVIHLATGRADALTETFIKDNAMEDISDVFTMTVPGESVVVKDKISGGFLDTSLTNPYADGKTYMAPMFYGPCGLFYNSALFTEKNWDIPTTWDEMWALGDLAKADGISLFTYPTAGYFDAFYYALMYEAGGADFFEKATTYTEGIWDSAEAKTTFDIVTKLASYTDKSVPANANGDNFLKNQQLVLDNKAIFCPNGTWFPGEMKDAPRVDGFEWGFMALPAITASGDRYSYTWFEQAWMPAGAENKELGKEFLAFLYSDIAVNIFATVGGSGGAFQPVDGIADMLEGDTKLFYSIYNDGAKAAMGNFAATDAVEGVGVMEIWFEPVNSLVSGAKTSDQWIAGIKDGSDRLRAALKD